MVISLAIMGIGAFQAMGRRALAAALMSLAPFALLSMPTPVLAQVNFSGTAITVIVPSRAGVPVDKWAKFWMPMIAENLPGGPEIEYKNLPGDNRGIDAANVFQSLQGTQTLFLFASSDQVSLPYAFNDVLVEYDYSSWQPLLVSPNGGVVYASPEVLDTSSEPHRFWPDNQLRMVLEESERTDALLMLSMEMLGEDFDVSFGARRPGDKWRAFRTGRSNVGMAWTGGYNANVRRMVREGSVAPLFSFGVFNGKGEFERDPNFPELPHFLEYYEQVVGGRPDGPAYDTWKNLYFASFSNHRAIFIHKGAPDDVLDALEQAVKMAVDDRRNWPDSSMEIIGEYDQLYGIDAFRQANMVSELSMSLSDWYMDFMEALRDDA